MLAQCEAGRQAAFVIMARDRHGHPVRSGGAGFVIDVTAGAGNAQGAHAYRQKVLQSSIYLTTGSWAHHVPELYA